MIKRAAKLKPLVSLASPVLHPETNKHKDKCQHHDNKARSIQALDFLQSRTTIEVSVLDIKY